MEQKIGTTITARILEPSPRKVNQKETQRILLSFFVELAQAVENEVRVAGCLDANG